MRLMVFWPGAWFWHGMAQQTIEVSESSVNTGKRFPVQVYNDKG
jgi:hypothetical protein